jgi:hypothetical protein
MICVFSYVCVESFPHTEGRAHTYTAGEQGTEEDIWV